MSDRSTSSASTDEKPALFRISKAFCGCAWECSPWSVLEKQERFVSTLMAECKIGPYRRGGAADDFFERDSSEDRMHGMLEDVQQTIHKLVTQVNQQNQLSLEDQKAEICDSQQIEATASPLSAPVPEQVARNFLKALQAQHVQGTQNAVGDFFSSEGHKETLTKFEDEVRGALEKTLFAFLKLLGTGPCFGDFKKEKLSPGVNLMDFHETWILAKALSKLLELDFHPPQPGNAIPQVDSNTCGTLALVHLFHLLNPGLMVHPDVHIIHKWILSQPGLVGSTFANALATLSTDQFNKLVHVLTEHGVPENKAVDPANLTIQKLGASAIIAAFVAKNAGHT